MRDESGYQGLKRLVERHELERAYRLVSWRPVLSTAWLWSQIIAIWVLVSMYPTLGVVLVAVPLIGSRYYALFIIGHDGLHRRLFESTTANDNWNDLFILGPIGAITRLNRHNHMKHHRLLGGADDPDRYKYENRAGLGPLAFAFSLTGLPQVVRAVTNVFLPRTARSDTADRYSLRDLAIIVGWQGVLFVGLSIAVGWWAYLVLWWIPVYVFTFAADVARVFCEHSFLEGERNPSTRLVTYSSNPVERAFFAPMNMNLHASHHLWPAVPYYNLPLVDRVLRERTREGDELVWRRSYVAFLVKAFVGSLSRDRATQIAR